MKKWRVWYNNNLIIEFDNEQEWADAPELGVQVVYEFHGYDRHGTRLGRLFQGSDWYWMYEGKMYENGMSTKTRGVWLPNPAPTGAICKRGLYLTDDEQTEFLQNLKNWLENG